MSLIHRPTLGIEEHRGLMADSSTTGIFSPSAGWVFNLADRRMVDPSTRSPTVAAPGDRP
jgi:hypothetical protein